MIFLPRSCASFDHRHFKSTLEQELLAQDDFTQLLQQAMQFGSCALLDDIQIMFNKTTVDGQYIQIQAGVFYHSIIAGCNCADDPSPVEKMNEYAEISITIDCQSARAILKTD